MPDSPPSTTPVIQSLAVAGAGYMGWQISLQAGLHGFPVTLTDPSPQALQRALELQRNQTAQWVAERRFTANEVEAAHARIAATTEIPAGADLVIEAIPEKLSLKRDLFARLDSLCPPHTILATNSSSLRISQIEDAVQPARRPLLLNLHFFGVVWNRPMVELMAGAATAPATLDAARAFVSAIGLTPLDVRKESTGFLFNRVWRAVKKECLTIANDGVASIEDIDRAWMIFVDQPIGPFGLMDQIGLDVIRDIELVYHRESGDPSDAPPPLLLDLIANGHLGVKSGRGFYSYPNPSFADPSFLRPR